MKTIYIMLSRSDTMVSKMISALSECEYTHASIAFEKDMSPMYSFARKGRMPLPAGLRLEYTDKGYYSEHGDIPCAVYELMVDDKAYYSAKRMVSEMMNQVDSYNYNVIGLLLCKLNISVYDREHHFFCSEFVGNVLTRSNALKLPKPPSLMRPNDYTNIPELSLCFQGKMEELARYCEDVRGNEMVYGA